MEKGSQFFFKSYILPYLYILYVYVYVYIQITPCFELGKAGREFSALQGLKSFVRL